MKNYIAYGSNMYERHMTLRCPQARLIGAGVLKGWRLMFKGDLPNSYATIEEENGFVVPALLWQISASDEEMLDRYESYPKFYYKRDITIEMQNGDKITGMAYVMDEEQILNCPCDHYYAVIYRAYKKFGFDVEILEEAMRYSDRLSRIPLLD